MESSTKRTRLSAKKWHYWLYTHTYKGNVPNNLCPYFWRLVIAVPLFLPLNIILLPWVIVSLILHLFQPSTDKEPFVYPKFLEDWGETIGVYIAGAILFVMTAIWWHIPKKRGEGDTIFTAGVMCWTSLILILLWALGAHIKEVISDRRYEKKRALQGLPPKERTPNMLFTYIKAKYKKHCPIIEWTDKD